MTRTDLLLVLMFVVAATLAFLCQKLLSRLIIPRASATRFLIYLILLMAVLFLIIFLYGFIVMRFRDYLFA